MIRVVCSRCGKPWTERDDIVALFNHSTLHAWIEAKFEGTPEWSARPGTTVEGLSSWIVAELELILALWGKTTGPASA